MTFEALLPWLALLAPAGLVTVFLASLREPGPWPDGVLGATRFAVILALSGAGFGTLAVGLNGAWTSPVIGVSGVGFSIRLDELSVTMLCLVASMVWVLLRFSRNYLGGDERQGRFLGLLALTSACVMLLVLAGNLFHLVVMWAVTSSSLHRLLVFYPERVGARVAGRKKFIVARLGDIALAVAAVLLYAVFGTADIGVLLDQAQGAAPIPGAALLAASLLVALSAILKSAQFPTHGWLLEVMETPTPVSALLHAGILNGGTFLVVRLGDVMLLSSPALHLLMIVGGFTSIFASLAMTTQNSVKVALGYSSAAHMGFMLFLCGLGAYPVAILHLVAHSFYKAHAFLASGSAVEAFQRGPRAPTTAPGVGTILAGMTAAVLTVGAAGVAVGVLPWEKPITFGLATVLAIGLTQLWTRGIQHRGTLLVLGRTMLYAVATTLAFFLLEVGAARLLGPSVAFPESARLSTLVLMSLVVAAFAATVLVQLRLPAMLTHPVWAAFWVHLRNGLYANTCLDRLVGALRIRPLDLNTRRVLR